MKFNLLVCIGLATIQAAPTLTGLIASSMAQGVGAGAGFNVANRAVDAAFGKKEATTQIIVTSPPAVNPVSTPPSNNNNGVTVIVPGSNQQVILSPLVKVYLGNETEGAYLGTVGDQTVPLIVGSGSKIVLAA